MNGALLAALALQLGAAPVAPAPPTVPLTMPGDVLSALAETEGALATLSMCIGQSEAVTPRGLAALDRRMVALQRRAAGVWGRQTELLLSSTAVPPDCSNDKSAAEYINAAERQLAQLTQRLNLVLAPVHSGLWFGTLPLCRTEPVQVQLIVDVYTAEPSLIITMGPMAAAELAALTIRHVGDALAFSVGGRVVIEPYIREPIAGGQLQISGPAEAELRQVAEQLKSCSKPAA